MIHNVDAMSPGELTASVVQLQIEAASLQVDMQMKMSVVTSSKDAIETLMKNQ
jgi:type III secretion inner rod protein HrpB2